MSSLLDIADPSTWPDEWLGTSMPTDIADPVDLYQELDHPGTTHPVACRLRDAAIEGIGKRYPGCVAYHCCRPLHAESYLKHGLWVTSEERLRQHAEECFGMLDRWEDAFGRALNKPGAPHYVDGWYGGTVGLSFTPFNYYCNGSLFGGRMAEALGEDGKRRWEEIRANTEPTVLVCRLPMDWITGDKTGGDLLADYASELLRAFMSIHIFSDPYQSQRAIHVLADIPPENILEARTLAERQAR